MKLNKFIILITTLCLLMGSSAAYATESQFTSVDNNAEQTYSIDITSVDSTVDESSGNDIESAINAINDTVKAEKIRDLYSLCYIVISKADSNEMDSTVPLNDNKAMIEKIHSLSKLSVKQLDAVLKETINNTILIIKTNPNAFLLPSASSIFEKYNFSEELEQIKLLKKNDNVSIENLNSMSVSIVDRTWTNTAIGTIKHALLGTTIATCKMKISWIVKNAKITSYTKTPSGSANSTYYKYISSKIISEGIPPYYLGQRANVNCSGKFQKLISWNEYDWIILDIWFYNDGGFDVSVDYN